MFCPKCGKELENGAAFCGYCGASLKAEPQYGSYYQQPAPEAAAAVEIDRQKVSKKEFIENYASQPLRKSINSISVVCYALAAISAVTGVTMTHNFYALIDAAILLALTLGMHLGKSKICAILLLIVSIIECVLTTIMLGTISGWWWIVAGISAVSSFVKLDKEYNLFLLQSAPIPTAPASPQSFAPIPEPVQTPAQTEVYYTPPQPTEPESASEQTVAAEQNSEEIAENSENE